jgi:hypothetical protein
VRNKFRTAFHWRRKESKLNLLDETISYLLHCRFLHRFRLLPSQKSALVRVNQRSHRFSIKRTQKIKAATGIINTKRTFQTRTEARLCFARQGRRMAKHGEFFSFEWWGTFIANNVINCSADKESTKSEIYCFPAWFMSAPWKKRRKRYLCTCTAINFKCAPSYWMRLVQRDPRLDRVEHSGNRPFCLLHRS